MTPEVGCRYLIAQPGQLQYVGLRVLEISPSGGYILWEHIGWRNKHEIKLIEKLLNDIPPFGSKP